MGVRSADDWDDGERVRESERERGREGEIEKERESDRGRDRERERGADCWFCVCATVLY